MNQSEYIQKICSLLKIERRLTDNEQKRILRWQEQRISDDVIVLAYERTISLISKTNFLYTDKIIEGWQAQGLQTAEEIKAALEKTAKKNVPAEDPSKIRRLVNELLEEYHGDLHVTYAEVSNHAYGSEPDKVLVAMKRELEHRITLNAMEEYGWEQTDTGEWRFVTSDEFSARYRAAMDRKKE